MSRVLRRRSDVDLKKLHGYGSPVSHELTDAISLELGRRTAERLRKEPALVRIAHENLARWSRLNAGAPSLLRCYAEWQHILKRSLEEICDVLTSDTEESQSLRQNSPFAGVLSAREVWEIKQRFRQATSTT